ncbi:hypothetical protein PPTG_21178 [Phytophthora nicotianae INRA-310]|uniref:SWIM-type domain-containing protein n=1 Tax=Phytophthora nicotianae (strain INRA-310) TaxID=761204 RepID=W2R331_PHYN3|nr:hypothetical protein PPTG_21178 [Phytophthora nicotianae INRA-310]ETN19827.1 hypothetical protein PPTG_21178 [Phytophthora nicotianae INRA-310]
MSQLMQLHHARALSALRKVYLAVMQKPLTVCYEMSDADKAQRNAVDEPNKQYNAVLKRDVTVHCKLYMGVLLGRLVDWCRLESARAVPFAMATVADFRLQRRSREMERQGLQSELVVSRHSVAFMIGETPIEAMSPDVVYGRYVAANRSYNEDLHRWNEDLPVSEQLGLNTARMEMMDMPSTGWKVDVRLMACPCRFFKKFACCTHILFAQSTRGHIDLFGRERLVRCATKKPGRLLLVKA